MGLISIVKDAGATIEAPGLSLRKGSSKAAIRSKLGVHLESLAIIFHDRYVTDI